jgi:hypothetical protein
MAHITLTHEETEGSAAGAVFFAIDAIVLTLNLSAALAAHAGENEIRRTRRQHAATRQVDDEGLARGTAFANAALASGGGFDWLLVHDSLLFGVHFDFRSIAPRPRSHGESDMNRGLISPANSLRCLGD